VFPNARASSGGWPSCARPSGPTPPPSASGSCAPAGARAVAAVLDLVQGLLDRWERRADVHALGEALQGLGMAGVANAYPLYEAIIVKLIFDLFHLLVRPAGDYLVVPT